MLKKAKQIFWNFINRKEIARLKNSTEILKEIHGNTRGVVNIYYVTHPFIQIVVDVSIADYMLVYSKLPLRWDGFHVCVKPVEGYKGVKE